MPITSKLAVIVEHMDQFTRETNEIQDATIKDLTHDLAVSEHERAALIEEGANLTAYTEELEQTIVRMQHDHAMARDRWTHAMMRFDTLGMDYRRRLARFADQLMMMNEVHGYEFIIQRDTADVPIQAYEPNPIVEHELEQSTEEESLESEEPEDEMFLLEDL